MNSTLIPPDGGFTSQAQRRVCGVLACDRSAEPRWHMAQKYRLERRKAALVNCKAIAGD